MVEMGPCPKFYSEKPNVLLFTSLFHSAVSLDVVPEILID